MKKITALMVLAVVFVLAGCASDEYAVEKRFYQTQKKAAVIFKNPDASPRNQLDAVVGSLADFSKKYPKKNLAIEAQFTIARLYIVKKDYESARRQLRAVLVQYKDSPPVCSEALFLMGNSYEIQDKWDSANAQYQKIIQDYPLTLRGLSAPVYIAQHYKIKYEPENMRSAYRQAIQHYGALANKYSDSELGFTAYQLVTQCYMELKEWQAAINTLNSIIEKSKAGHFKGKVNPDAILLNIAIIYGRQMQDKLKAKETLEILIRDYPRSKLAKSAANLLKELEKK